MKPVPVELTDKLVDAAGIAATGPGLAMSMDDLAKASGVPRATLYYYFGGKNDLLTFYVGVMIKRMRDAVADGLGHDGTPPERIEAVIGAVMRTFALYPRMCVEMSSAMGDLIDYNEVMIHMQTGIIAPTIAVLEEGVESGDFDIDDPQVAVLSMLGAMHMVATMDIVGSGELDAAARSKSISMMTLKAIAA
jgi:TetR/AcrR family transcriptional regulator